MTRIEKLTPEQEAYLPVFRNEWLQIGLSTEPVDRIVSTAAVKRLYAAGGKSEPIVLHFDSPAQCILAINMLQRAGEADLRDNLGDNLRDNLGDNIWANLRLIYTPFWGGQDAHLVAWGLFAKHIGCPLTCDEHLEAYAEYVRTSGWGYFYDGIAFVSDRPERIVRNDAGRLSNDKGPAIKFRDGYSVYAFNGTNIPAEWIEERDTIDPSVILTDAVPAPVADAMRRGDQPEPKT